MKKLILMRHAKSSWNHPNLSDYQRPLNPRGKRDAPRMGALLQAEGVEIDAILCSTAARARETLAYFFEEFTFEGELRFLEKLYRAELRDFIEVLAELPNEVETAMILGHNPTMAYALDFFCDEPKAFPTAAVARIAFKIEAWDTLIENPEGELLNFWTPKGDLRHP